MLFQWDRQSSLWSRHRSFGYSHRLCSTVLGASGSPGLAGSKDVLRFEVQAALIIGVPEAFAVAFLASSTNGLRIVALQHSHQLPDGDAGQADLP